MKNILAIILQIWGIFLKKGYPTAKCNDLMNDPDYRDTVEEAIVDYVKCKDCDTTKSSAICGYIFELFMPSLIVAFNHAFWDPRMFKTNENEVENLRRAFYSESFFVFRELLEYVTKGYTEENIDSVVIRERLARLLFRRLTTVAYRRVVETELPDYPCNLTSGEQNLRNIEKQFEETYGRSGTDEELSEFAGCMPVTIRRNRESLNAKMTVSLDLEVGDSDRECTFGECLRCNYRDHQPEKVIDDMFNADIDRDLRSTLSEREYRRIRTRIDNDDMPEIEIAKEEIGIDGDPKVIRADKRIRATQKSINRDLNSAKIKLRVVMEQYKDDIL